MSRFSAGTRPLLVRSRPWVGVAAVAGAGALLLAGCARGSSDQQSPSFTSRATVSGSLHVMGFGTGDDVGKNRYDRAAAAMPGVKISLSQGELDVQAFLSAVASGKPPDLVYASRDQIGTFASRGAIVPLDDCLASEHVDPSQFVGSAVQQVTFAQHVYGLPEFSTVELTMANKNLLADAGVTLDDVNGSSWDAVTAANKAMAKQAGGKVSVIGYDSKLPEFLPLWAKANGADLISADGRKAQLDDPRVVQALEFAAGIYRDQGGFAGVKTFRDSADFFGKGNQFAAGTLGAMPMENWYVNTLNEVSPSAPLAFDTVRDTSGTPLAFTSGNAWAIPKGAANPQAACRFARLMTETDAWLTAAKDRVSSRTASDQLFTGLLTANKAADQQIRERYVPKDAPEPWKSAIDAIYAANDHTFAMPANPADAAFKTAWQDAVNRVLNGQQEPQAALAQAQQEAQKALDDAWATWDERTGR